MTSADPQWILLCPIGTNPDEAREVAAERPERIVEIMESPHREFLLVNLDMVVDNVLAELGEGQCPSC